jgi:hypothetical protein
MKGLDKPIHACIHTYIHTIGAMGLEEFGFMKGLDKPIHTYIYTYMHTYIHTYIHTYNRGNGSGRKCIYEGIGQAYTTGKGPAGLHFICVDAFVGGFR